MSIEQQAFMIRDNVPAVTAWQAAITELGYDFQLDPTLKPFENSGFLPCKLGQLETGFEIYYEPANELFDTYPHIKEQMGPRDFAISFRWGADMGECASVLIASAALAKSFDAVVYYPDDDQVCTLDYLKTEIASVLKEVKNPSDRYSVAQPRPASPPQYEDSKPSEKYPPAPSKRWWEFWK